MFDGSLLIYSVFVMVSDSTPVPITPDYGSSVVSYADGIFDSRFNRFVTVMEGILSWIILLIYIVGCTE